MKRRTGGTRLLATLGKQAARSARRLQRTVAQTVTNPVLRVARQQGQAVSKAMGRAVGKAARQAFTGVVTPAPTPVSKGGGIWEEGLWGFSLGIGSMAQRRYRVFVPPGVSAARPAPPVCRSAPPPAAGFTPVTASISTPWAWRCRAFSCCTSAATLLWISVVILRMKAARSGLP